MATDDVEEPPWFDVDGFAADDEAPAVPPVAPAEAPICRAHGCGRFATQGLAYWPLCDRCVARSAEIARRWGPKDGVRP
jgi:hypothetical protein